MFKGVWIDSQFFDRLHPMGIFYSLVHLLHSRIQISVFSNFEVLSEKNAGSFPVRLMLSVNTWNLSLSKLKKILDVILSSLLF